MRKRVRRLGPKKDRISQLPDEILVRILSCLTVKEAADTSVLSRRWRSLWTWIDRLDFDGTKPWDEVALKTHLWKRHMKKYMRWVSSTLEMCKGQRLEQFRICFHLKERAQYEIDKWLEFAFSREVQRLELDLYKGGEGISTFESRYAFPARLLGLGDSAHSPSCIPHSNNLQILPLVKQNFKSLKVLLLKFVDVSGQVLEFFLHSCPLIETMVVHGSRTLINLEIVGPSLKLKHLEISCCCHVESLKICDTNLITLRTSSGRELMLKNAPMLVNVDILCKPYTHLLNDISSCLSCFFSQLEVLTVHASLSLFDLPREELEHYNFPELTKLKKFVLTAHRSPSIREKDQSLLGCTSIIRAAPQLKGFELQLSSGPFTVSRWCKKAAIKCPLHHLKVVKLWGFYGGVFHLELIRYFLENAVALEKLIIDPTSPLFCRGPLDVEGMERLQTARNLAKLQLEREVPQAIELVIL